MKSKFARCAKERQDRENEIRFDADRVGEVFSQSAANKVLTHCHKTPQMHDMRNTDDNMHGAEKYITHAKRPFMNTSINRKNRDDDMSMMFALGVMYAIETPHWAHGDTAATHDYAPRYN